MAEANDEAIQGQQDQPAETDQAEPANSSPKPVAKESAAASQDQPAKAPRNRQTLLLQGLLAVNTVLMLLVVCVFLNLIPKPSLEASTVLPTPQREQTAGEILDSQASPGSGTPEILDSLPDRPKVVSWKQAENFYREGRFDQAIDLFRQLVINSRHVQAEQLVCDYFSVRIGQCLARSGRQKEAEGVLENLSLSGSPILRAVARYELALMDLSNERYLAARSQAYRAIAALGCLERPMPLEADCDFIIGQTLTEKVRGFHTNDRFIRWPEARGEDVFDGMTREELRTLLFEGRGRIPESALGPELRVRAIASQPGRYEVACANMTVEELLNQFGEQVGMDVEWTSINESVLRRPVNLYFCSVSPQKLSEVAAGMAGLMARYSLNGSEMLIRVYNPQSASSRDDQETILSEGAMSIWQLFGLRHPNDHRLPEARFAMAAMREWSEQTVNAAQEYEMLASRFERARVAPEATLRAARLKIRMHDYIGARKNLLDVLDLYPDYPGSDEVYLSLGKVYEASGDLDEAASTYENLYHRNITRDSRRQAALGAGRCFYRQEQYEQSSIWLARYVAMIPEPNPDDYADAYFMLGKSEAARGNYHVAVQAYHRGLLGKPLAEKRIPAVLDLVEIHILQEDYVGALGIINTLQSARLTPQQSTRQAILLGRAYREMGLVDRARSVLRLEFGRHRDQQLRGEIGIELAKCHCAAGDTASARTLLSDLLPKAPAGLTQWKLSAELAELCLREEEPAQAVVLLAPVLRAKQCPTSLRRAVMHAMGEAHLQLGEYALSAWYFSGMQGPRPGSDPEAKNNAPLAGSAGGAS